MHDAIPSRILNGWLRLEEDLFHLQVLSYLPPQIPIFSILKTGSCQSFLFFSIALIVQAKPVIIESSIAPPIASFIPAPKKKPTNAAITIRMIEMITLIIYTSINKNLSISNIFLPLIYKVHL